MDEAPNEFGDWKTAPDGIAHYVLGDYCLCGAKVRRWGGPPERKQLPSPGPLGKIITELCQRCLDQNYLRWAKKGGKPTYVLAQRLDRRHRRRAIANRKK